MLSELGVFLFPVGLEDNSSDNSAPALKSEKGPAKAKHECTNIKKIKKYLIKVFPTCIYIVYS